MKKTLILLLFIALPLVTIAVNSRFSGPEFNGRIIVAAAFALGLLRPRRPWLWAVTIWTCVEAAFLLRMFGTSLHFSLLKLATAALPEPNVYLWIFLPVMPAAAASHLGGWINRASKNLWNWALCPFYEDSATASPVLEGQALKQGSSYAS